MSRLLVTGDTHLMAAHLPAWLLDLAQQADAVLHTGDIVAWGVLRQLAQNAPVYAVRGNQDDVRGLPDRLLLSFGGIRIGLCHGHLGPARLTTPARALAAFEGTEDLAAVVFGHSHMPQIERVAGVLALNPGSATRPRRAPRATAAWLEIADGEARAALVYAPS